MPWLLTWIEDAQLVANELGELALNIKKNEY